MRKPEDMYTTAVFLQVIVVLERATIVPPPWLTEHGCSGSHVCFQSIEAGKRRAALRLGIAHAHEAGKPVQHAPTVADDVGIVAVNHHII